MILETTLIILSVLFFFQSTRAILNKKSNSVADYIMIIIYVFNCLPVLLDNVLGIPDYLSIGRWFVNFEKAMNDELVRTVYDLYVLLVILVLKFYLHKHKIFYKNKQLYIYSLSCFFHGKVLLLVAMIPILLALLFGHWQEYFVFMSASNRGLSGSQLAALWFFELLGLFAFYCWFFEYNNGKLKSYFWVILYTAIIIWIDGKRYIIVTAALMFIFFYLNSMYAKEKKIPLTLLLSFLGCCFIIFYIWYAFAYKVNSVVESVSNIIYATLRIDFGRDDVTKFVLYKEIIENNPILDYRFQTILSPLFMFIPRELWSTKPYPHYRYLTAALYNTDVLSIPAGMTPSLFEMSIANFGVVVGIIMTPVILIGLISLADKAKTIPLKILYLLFINALLTQSLDAIIVVVLLLPLSSFFKKFRIKIR